MVITFNFLKNITYVKTNVIIFNTQQFTEKFFFQCIKYIFMVKINVHGLYKKTHNNFIEFKPKETLGLCEIIFSLGKNMMEETMGCKIYTKFIENIEFSYISHTDKTLVQTKLSHENQPVEGILLFGTIGRLQTIKILIQPFDLCSRIIIKKYINPVSMSMSNPKISLSWDKILIINLERRNDRKFSMINKLSKIPITNYEFINGFDGNSYDVQTQFNILVTQCKTKIVSVGHYACLLSHIKALEQAKMEKLSSVMILEDDVEFCDGFIGKIACCSIPMCDFVYLGGIIDKKKVFVNNWGQYDVIMGAYAYVVYQHMYDYLIDGLKKQLDYVDLFCIKNVQKTHRVIILNDFVKTNLDSSDTSDKCKKMIQRMEYIK